MNTKRLPWIMFGTLFGLYALISFGMTLPYTYSYTDIVLYTSVLPEVLDALIDLTEIAVFAIGFSLLMYAAFYHMTVPQKICLLGIFLVAVLFRRICDLFVSCLVFSSLDMEDLIYAIPYLILDWLLIGGVYLLIGMQSKKYDKKMLLKAKASALFQEDIPLKQQTESLYPFQKLFDRNNALQNCVLSVGILLSSVKVATRIIYDISYGTPADWKEILIMAVYYCSDIALGFLFYCGTLLVLSRFLKPKAKKNSEH